MLDLELLNSYVAKNISEICLNGYTNNNINHCAHFVSHVINLHFGCTCDSLVPNSAQQGFGANIRVHEVFAQCPAVYEFDNCPTETSGLIFVSARTNFRGNPVNIQNVPKKHIGIILNGHIWHYSNTRDRVEVQTMLGFIHHYPRQQNSLWFGSLPRMARPAYWGVC